MTKRWRIVISTKRNLFLWGWELPWAIEKSSWGTENESDIHHLFQAFQISKYFKTSDCLNWSPKFSYAKVWRVAKKPPGWWSCCFAWGKVVASTSSEVMWMGRLPLNPKLNKIEANGEMLRYEVIVIWYVTQRLIIHLRITGFFR